MKQLGATDPRRVGPYTLVARLGSGGMGAVYLGRSAGGRTVAVKLVRSDLAHDEVFRNRFRIEVAAAREVKGAFTAPVVDADTETEIPWMASAFVVGVSLHQAIASRGPLPARTLWTLTAGLAEALTEVHGARLIHRDLKPANVLLALDGPHVIDFGIARSVDGTQLTATGGLIGSAAYMSPEQARGEALMPASDVFSLGSTIAYAARGSHLFGVGEAVAILYRVMDTEPDLGPVPRDLRPLIAACLAKDAADRPTPRQVVESVERETREEQGEAPKGPGGWLPDAVTADIIAVRTVLTSLPEPPPIPQPPPLPPPRGTSRRKLILGLTGGALLTAGAGVAIGLTQGGHAAARANRPSGDDVPEGRLAWKVPQSAGCGQVLSAGGVVACVAAQKVWGLDDQGHPKWTVETGSHGIDMTAAGSGPATVAALHDGRVYVTGMSISVANGASAAKGGMIGIDMAGGKVEWSTAFDKPPVGVVARFHGFLGGRAYLHVLSGTLHQNVGTEDQDIVAVDLATRKVAWYREFGEFPLYSALSQAGGRAVFSSYGTMRAYDDGGSASWSKGIRTSGFIAAGRYVVAVDERRRMFALDPATGKQAWTATGVVNSSPRGSGLATNDDGSVVYAVWRDADGGYSLGGLDSRTGGTRWKRPVPADAKGSKDVGASILYADGNLYRLGADSVVWAFDPANGEPRWKYTGFRGTNPLNLGWAAGDGRLCITDPANLTVAALHANGA